MTLRECATQICRENGMAEPEIDEFMAFAHENDISGGEEMCDINVVEVLPEENQKLFMKAMRIVVPEQVQRFRDASEQQSISA